MESTGDRHLHVDGEDFVVTYRPGPPGAYDFTWTSGRHEPSYGFRCSASSEEPMTDEAMRGWISDFLSEINPETGYLD